MSLNRTTSAYATQMAAFGSHAPSQDHHQTVLNNFREKMKSSLSGTVDHSFLASVIDAIQHTDAIDDRKLLLEHVLTLLAHLPDGPIPTKLQNATVELLYNDLPHPAATYIGHKYAWRTADGAGNNVQIPDMGRAGTPYSRSVQQTHSIPQNTMPDSGLVFDTLLKREGFIPHPAGLSSMMFSWAALVIHSVFRTSHRDVNINETSSYVDLSPLYGHDQAAQDKVRKRDGRGMLYPDVFAEDRLLFLPPAVCVILVLFCRNHNYIAKKLLEINERGNYIDPGAPSESSSITERLMHQDEEIFQITRLINATWFASIVFSDYFSAILGLVRDGNSWSLNPFGEIRNEDHSLFPRGEGNVCSVEFNCLYRWHATTSVEDEQWVTLMFSKIFPGKTPDQITPDDFKKASKKLAESEPDVQHWTFGLIQRQADGTFKDSDLAKILKDATDHPAGAFRARGTPGIMRLHEIMGIEQNRRWGVCSLNDFRKFLGLKTYTSFKEWNPNPEIHEAAEKLYGNIDRLELYVGLQAEEAKPVVEGAGLCPGYTISRAILSDAIALTRGDRFYTQDYTPYNMTAWGFADCQRTPAGSGFGSTLGRLFLRTLPNDYDPYSTYTWFPLMTPQSMQGNLKKLKNASYSFDRPIAVTPVQVVTGYHEIAQILKDTGDFRPDYAARAAKVINGGGFFLATEDPSVGEREQHQVLEALLGTPDAADKIGTYFYNKTRDLIAANKLTLVGGQSQCVDIVRYVLKHVPIYWVATEIAGIPLKKKGSSGVGYTPDQLFDILCNIYSVLFLDIDTGKKLALETQARSQIKDLLCHIKRHLSTGQRLSIAGFVDALLSLFEKSKNSEVPELVHRLQALGRSHDEIANSILAILVGFTVELTIALTNTTNVLLGSSQGAKVRGLAAKPGPEGQLDAFVREALRMDPPFRGIYRYATKDKVVGSLSSRKGHGYFLDIADANVDGSVFEKPKEVVMSRALEKYLNGDVSVRCMGEKLTTKVIGEVLRAVFSLPNVRRAPGQSGVLSRFRDDSPLSRTWSYLDENSYAAPWPTSLILQFDAI